MAAIRVSSAAYSAFRRSSARCSAGSSSTISPGVGSFYINLPFGILALAVINATFQAAQARVKGRDRLRRRRAAGAGACLLSSSSPVSERSLTREAPVSMFAISLLGIVSLGAFIYVETKVADPLLPLSLFANRAFALAAAIGFIVGMALFGSITLLPVYLQVVEGTRSDQRRAASDADDARRIRQFDHQRADHHAVSAATRYFPIMGTALMTIGTCPAIADHGLATSASTASVYMLLLGLGLGMVMQILVMAVQNAVAYEQLGVATSGTTLFRSIGGAVGAALFGGIFAYTLEGKIDVTLPEAAAQLSDPARSPRWPSRCAPPIWRCSSSCCTRCFSPPRCWRSLAFLLSFAIKEVPLRTSIETKPVSDPFQMPRDATSLEGTRAHRRAGDSTREPLARLSALGGAPEHSSRARRALAAGTHRRANRPGRKGGTRQAADWRSATFADLCEARGGRYGVQDVGQHIRADPEGQSCLRPLGPSARRRSPAYARRLGPQRASRCQGHDARAFEIIREHAAGENLRRWLSSWASWKQTYRDS